MRIAIFGNHAELVHQALRAAGHELALVVVVDNYSFAKDVKRRGILWALVRRIAIAIFPLIDFPFLPNHLKTVRYCRKNGIQVFPHRLVNDELFIFNLYRLKLDLLVNVGCPAILSQAVLDSVPLAINIHAGKLPVYAGAHTLTWAILNYEDEYTLTAHKMVATVDAGDIALERKYPINLTDRFPREVLIAHYAMVLEVVESVADKTIKFTPQHRTPMIPWPLPRPVDFEIRDFDDDETRERKKFAAKFYGA